jgi:hypothetical protein
VKCRRTGTPKTRNIPTVPEMGAGLGLSSELGDIGVSGTVWLKTIIA